MKIHKLIKNLDLTVFSGITDKDVERIRKNVREYELLTAGEALDVRVQCAACVAEMLYVMNFCFNNKNASVSDCQHRLATEYRLRLKSILPRLDAIIEKDYEETPIKIYIKEEAREVKQILIELFGYMDRYANAPEEDFDRSDLTVIGYVLEYVINSMIPYTKEYMEPHHPCRHSSGSTWRLRGGVVTSKGHGLLRRLGS